MESKESIIGTIPRNDSEEIQIRLIESDKGKSIDLRQFYRTDDKSDKWFPTKKGCRLSSKQAENLFSIMRKLESELKN